MQQPLCLGSQIPSGLYHCLFSTWVCQLMVSAWFLQAESGLSKATSSCLEAAQMLWLSMQGFEEQALLLQFRKNMTSDMNLEILIRLGSWMALSQGPTTPSAWSCFFPFLHVLYVRASHPENVLHANFHLRVYFGGTQPSCRNMMIMR